MSYKIFFFVQGNKPEAFIEQKTTKKIPLVKNEGDNKIKLLT